MIISHEDVFSEIVVSWSQCLVIKTKRHSKSMFSALQVVIRTFYSLIICITFYRLHWHYAVKRNNTCFFSSIFHQISNFLPFIFSIEKKNISISTMFYTFARKSEKNKNKNEYLIKYGVREILSRLLLQRKKNGKKNANATVNIDTQGVQELFFCVKCPR